MSPTGRPETSRRMPAGRVVVVGAVNVDLVVAARHLPRPGQTVVGGDLQRHGGGKGANASVAAARAGAEVHLVGAVGDDPDGAGALADLRADGVHTEHVAVRTGVPTGVALIVVDAEGENQIAVGAGANATVTPEQVVAALEALLAEPARPTGTTCVLVSTEIPVEAVVAAIAAATAAGARCVLNPAPVVRGLEEALRHGPVLTPNRSECLDLQPVTAHPGDVAASAAALAQRTGAPVVVTLGGAGVLLLDGDTRHELPAQPGVVVRDTTGAGDTFNGVLAARLAAGDALPEAVGAAVTAAGRSVEHVGARAGMPFAD